MHNFTIACFMLIILLSGVALLITVHQKCKEVPKEYKQLLILKDWYEKISEEANRSYIIESVEKRGQELINQLNLLNTHAVEMQKQHKQLQEEQCKLHAKLLKEHELLNQYFKNYS